MSLINLVRNKDNFDILFLNKLIHVEIRFNRCVFIITRRNITNVLSLLQKRKQWYNVTVGRRSVISVNVLFIVIEYHSNANNGKTVNVTYSYAFLGHNWRSFYIHLATARRKLSLEYIRNKILAPLSLLLFFSA